MINAQYTGRAAEPTGLACLCGKTQGQPEAQAYREQQLVKLKNTAWALHSARRRMGWMP